MNRDHIFKDEDGLITEVIKFFFASVLQKDHFEKVVEKCLENPSQQGNRHLLIRQGKFGLSDFLFYWQRVIQPGGGLVKGLVIEEVLRRFCDCHLLTRSQMLLEHGLDFYQVNEPFAEFLLQRDALENLAFDFPHLVQKYRCSIVKILICDDKGDQWIGTGFFCAANRLIITNKHVVEEQAEGFPIVKNANGDQLVVKNLEKDTCWDLAIIEVEPTAGVRPLFPATEVEILDQIITIGYPRIPLALNHPLVAHSGEINGQITLQDGDYLIFSSKTAPGNSGGPLLNRAGLVVGVVTQELQSQVAIEKKILPYYCAIPIKQLIPFLQKFMEKYFSV